MTRLHFIIRGRVQGIGYRWFVRESAEGLGLVGWVKNLRDGRVELVAEAEESILTQFLETIRTGPMKNFIAHVEVSWSSASDTFDEFEIRYY